MSHTLFMYTIELIYKGFYDRLHITMAFNGHLTAWFLWRKSLCSIIRQRNHAVKSRWCQTLIWFSLSTGNSILNQKYFG